MIILSGVLVVVAIALLVTGIVTGNTGHEILGLDGLKLIYVSIGVSIVSALFLAVGVFLRRKELFGAVAPANAKASAGRTTTRPVKTKARVGAGEDAPMVPATSATAIDVPAETTVWVVPGRKRYHLETCRQLAGREKEELTFVEAREEGFTACTACLPDTALAVRAALTDTEPVDDRPTETRTVADTKPQSAALDPVEVTRTDIPVTPALPAAERPSAEDRDALTGSRAGGATESPTADAHDAESTVVEQAAAEPTSAERTAAEAPEETLVERPQRRSRSLFEPLERAESDAAAADAGSATDEKTGTGSADAGHRDEDEAATARSADEPETAEPQDALGGADEAADAAATPETDDTDHAGSEAQDAPVADATADDTVAAGSEAETVESETAPSDEHGERDEEPVAAEAATEPEPVDDETDATETTDATDDEPDADASDPSTESSADDTDAEKAEEAEEKAEPADDSGDAEADPTVRILSGTRRYHRSDCALIEDIADDADDLESMPREAARERGCTPCLVCQPDDD